MEDGDDVNESQNEDDQPTMPKSDNEGKSYIIDSD